MKIRNGFVSNSSSSSFIVQWKTDMWDNLGVKCKDQKILLSNKQIKILVENGFKLTTCNSATRLEYSDPKIVYRVPKSWSKDGFDAYYGCSMTCNQSITASILIRWKIPFVASIHYNHHVWIYKAGWKNVVEIDNHGELADMHHQRDNMLSLTKAFSKKKSFRKIPIKDI